MSKLTDVIDFIVTIIGLPQSEALNDERMDWFRTVINEELNEFEEANKNKDKAGMLDALIDLLYFAYGRIFEVGISPEVFEDAWQKVHEANMRKQKGNKGRGSDFDAIKPEGWKAPEETFKILTPGLPVKSDLDKLFGEFRVSPKASYTVSTELDVETINAIPKAFIEATKIMLKKSEDYNNGEKTPQSRANYFPFGLLSYAQMLHTKTQRLNSLVSQNKTPNNESIRDTLIDMINYANFTIEAIDKGEI